MPKNPALIKHFQKLLGKRIRERRRAAGLTQLVLSEKLQVPRTTLANIETGAQRASAFFLAHLARALNVSMGQLIPDIAEAEARCDEQSKVPLEGAGPPALVARRLAEQGVSVTTDATLQDALQSVQNRKNDSE